MSAPQSGGERPVGDLVRDLSEQTATLVRKELALAQVELTEKGKAAGIGGGLLGGAGIVALYGVGALIATVILLLATFLAAWLGALIVTVVLIAIAGGLALLGKGKVDEASPAKPEQAIDSVQTDVDTLKERAGR